jgi:hypothetical protein
MAVMSALCAGRPVRPGRFLVLISLRAIVTHSEAGRIRSIEKSNDLIGNRTRDIPACSIVPERSTLPLPPINIYNEILWNTLYPVLNLIVFLLVIVRMSQATSANCPYFSVCIIDTKDDWCPHGSSSEPFVKSFWTYRSTLFAAKTQSLIIFNEFPARLRFQPANVESL